MRPSHSVQQSAMARTPNSYHVSRTATVVWRMSARMACCCSCRCNAACIRGSREIKAAEEEVSGTGRSFREVRRAAVEW